MSSCAGAHRSASASCAVSSSASGADPSPCFSSVTLLLQRASRGPLACSPSRPSPAPRGGRLRSCAPCRAPSSPCPSRRRGPSASSDDLFAHRARLAHDERGRKLGGSGVLDRRLVRLLGVLPRACGFVERRPAASRAASSHTSQSLELGSRASSPIAAWASSDCWSRRRVGELSTVSRCSSVRSRQHLARPSTSDAATASFASRCAVAQLFGTFTLASIPRLGERASAAVAYSAAASSSASALLASGASAAGHALRRRSGAVSASGVQSDSRSIGCSSRTIVFSSRRRGGGRFACARRLEIEQLDDQVLALRRLVVQELRELSLRKHNTLREMVERQADEFRDRRVHLAGVASKHASRRVPAALLSLSSAGLRPANTRVAMYSRRRPRT